MSTTSALVISLLLAALIVAAFRKPIRTMVGGFISRDRKGRITIALTPTPRKRRKRRRK